jgi:hypothetical protein
MSKYKLKNLMEGSSVLFETLEWKDVPEEDRNKAIELIDKHNKSADDSIKGYYAIDVTGKHQVYYTFWRYKEIDPMFAAYIKNPIYMGNLSTNLLSSVENAIKKAHSTRLELISEETKEGLIGKTKETPIFTFGKYRGKSCLFCLVGQEYRPKICQYKSLCCHQVFCKFIF